MTIPELKAALDAIGKQTPAQVHAGRKGVCVGYMVNGKGTIMFRRKNDEIWAEYWPPNIRGQKFGRQPLSPALAARAAKLIDR